MMSPIVLLRWLPRRLVARSASSASATHALNIFIVLHLVFRDSADACAVEVRLFCLDAAKATELFVAWLLPLRNKHCISIPILQQPLVELLADGLLCVIKFVDVATPLVRDLEHFPLRLVPGTGRRRLVLGILHLVGEDEEVCLDVAEALWRWLPLR